MGIINDFFGAILNFIFNFVDQVIPIGTLGATIIIFTIITRILLTPLQISQQRTSRAMNKIQPEMQRLQNKYKDKKDQQSQLAYSQELQAMYKKYKINPLAGCLPLLIQFPLIIALFNVLREPNRYIYKLGNMYSQASSVVLEKVPDYTQALGGISEAVSKTVRGGLDLSTAEGLTTLLGKMSSTQWGEFLANIPADAQQALSSILEQKNNYEWFIGINLVDTAQQLVATGLWLALLIPIISGLSTFIYSKITMAANMPNQNEANSENGVQQTQQMMKTMNAIMPIMTAMFAYAAPIGLALYWIASNFIMMIQQFFVNKYVDQQTEKIEAQIRKEEEERRRKQQGNRRRKKVDPNKPKKPKTTVDSDKFIEANPSRLKKTNPEHLEERQ